MARTNMAKKYQDRWMQEPGKSILEAIRELSQSEKAPTGIQSQLLLLLQDLPYSQEIPESKDLRGVPLVWRNSGVDFHGYDFSYSDLAFYASHCNLQHARFDYATVGDLAQNDLSHARFFKTDMRRCFLEKVTAHFCNFEHAQLALANLKDGDFRHSSFVATKCNGTVFCGARLEHCNFQQAKLEHAVLAGSHFDHTTDFRGASLKGAYLEEHRDIYGNLVAAGVDWKTALHDETTIPPQ